MHIRDLLQHPDVCRRYGWREVECVVSEGELALKARLVCGHEDSFTVPYMGAVVETAVRDLLERLDEHPCPCTCEASRRQDEREGSADELVARLLDRRQP